jgi:hypothetical protein
MSKLLAATEPARTIVIERGGTAWWLPFVTTLGVALAAALASYVVTWRFKRADVDRENAIRAIDLVDEAEQLASREDIYRDAGGATATLHLLQMARVRAQPIDDPDLDDCFRAAQSYNFDLTLWDEQAGRALHWLREAIANVRAALVPHLAAPKLVRRTQPPEHSFPTLDELNAMASDPGGRDGNVRLDALVDWRANRG